MARSKPTQRKQAQLAHFHGGPGGGRAFGGQRQRFLARVAIQQEEAADHFLGLGEGAVDHAALAVAHAQPHALGVGFQRFGALQQAALVQAFGIAQHGAIGLAALFGRALGALADRFDDQEQIGHGGRFLAQGRPPA